MKVMNRLSMSSLIDPFVDTWGLSPAEWVISDEVSSEFLGNHGFDDCHLKECYKGCYIHKHINRKHGLEEM